MIMQWKMALVLIYLMKLLMMESEIIMMTMIMELKNLWMITIILKKELKIDLNMKFLQPHLKNQFQ